MRVGELIQRVQSLYSKGVESDDSRLTRRHIYNKLLSARSLLIYRKVNKRQYINRWNYTMLPCVELITVPTHQCPCIPPKGCEILRSKEKLPKAISSLNKHIIDAVTSIEGSIVFDETTWKGRNWRKGDKYTSTKPDFFILEGYLYVTVSSKIKAVSVLGLFNDPVEAQSFPSYCDENCIDCEQACTDNPMDMEFSIDEELIEPLIEMAKVELVKEFNASREDISNNSRDNLQQESK